MSELFHECGIAAVYSLPGADGPRQVRVPSHAPSALIPRMLLDIQNRGQLAAGMTTYQPDRTRLLDTYKDVGTVSEVFRLNHCEKAESIMRKHAGRAAIGHVRYATCGPDDRSYAQPFEREHGRKWKWFSFAFNGQLANYFDLKNELLSKTDYHISRDTDTEIIQHALSYEFRSDDKPDLVEVFQHLSRKFDGAYNIAFMNALGDMVIARDPLGLRPLCYARDGSLFAAASESLPLANLGFKAIEPLPPGQLILIEDGRLRIEKFAESSTTAHCFFEWIYFANVASSLDDRSVYLTRAGLGRELAQLEDVPRDADTIVVPVPDTAKAAADAMAFELGLPSVEGIMRNRYVGRTFIESSDRAGKAKLKYTPLREVLEGKRVLLVEDSIVRSTTMHALIEEIRTRGRAKEIHVRVACPPIVAPCFYGIDMSTVGELFAPRFLDGGPLTEPAQRAMAADLGADSLRYLSIEAIARALGLNANQLCRACITGQYPTAYGNRLYQIARLNQDRLPSANGQRTYELQAGPCHKG